MKRLTPLKAFIPATVLVLSLSACTVPAALVPEREAATPMPVRADGITEVNGTVAGYEGPAGTIEVTFQVGSNETTYVTGDIRADGSFSLELQVPPREALYPVRDAWTYSPEVISSNPQARLAFIYAYGVHEGRERPSGWITMDTQVDPEEDYEVGDMYAAYVYANEPTRIRINDQAASGGHRYVADLNLARGWNRVVTEVVNITADVVTYRETVDYTTAVPWQYVENEN